MFAHKPEQWLESYLYRACGHRALEQSVLAQGERLGFCERRLRRAARSLSVHTSAGCWELDPVRVTEMIAREIAVLELVPTAPPQPRVLRPVA